MICSCPQCNARLGMPPETAGKSVRCSKCGHEFKVPRDANEIPTVEPISATGIVAAPAPPVQRQTPITTQTPKHVAATIPKYLRLLALLPVGIIIIANTPGMGGGGLIRGAIWGGLGGLLAGACLWIAQRARWPLAIRICSMLGIAIVGYGVLIGVAVAPKLLVALGGGWSEFSPLGGGYHV